MAKKKKNKQPPKKRNKGVLLTKENVNVKENNEDCKNEFLFGVLDSDEGANNKNENFLKEYANKFKINKRKNEVTNVYAKVFMPKDTRENLIEDIDNFGLFINKFPYFELGYDKKNKKSEFKAVFYEKYCIKNYKEFANNFYKSLEKLKFKKEFNLEISDKLVIGLGGVSVYETSITFHHIYGVPYIPASAIKGSFRSYVIEKSFKDENEALKKKWFVDIFGNEEKQDKVIFFDAFCLENLEIKKDIINVHYQKYYTGEGLPTDEQNPVPINFLAVKGKFKFVFAVRDKFEIEVEGKKENILDFVERELKNSLQNFGIGAKTSVGYGYFK